MRRQGFTLIELLVVIAIIAVLAAVIFPILTSARERGKQMSCLSNVKQLSAGFIMYAADNTGAMPSLSRYVDGIVRGLSNPPMDWCGSDSPVVGCLVSPQRGSIFPWVRSRKVYLCPSEIGFPAKRITGSPKDYAISYNVNYQLHYAKLDSATNGRTSKVLMMMQEGREYINDGYFGWTSGVDWPSKVHYEGTTVSYCDGHAKWRSFTELDKERARGNWYIYR